MSTPNVLVVEDEDNISFLLESALGLAGMEVASVATGEAAIARIRTDRPDVVLLDIMLPDVDGYEVLRRVRNDGWSGPILFLTARDSAAERVRGLTSGGDDYITKPFALEEVVARVQVALRRSGHSDEVTLRVGELELDDEAYEVRCKGDVIHLTPTEYKLLRMLMSNAGRVVTRSQILDHVWEYDFDGESAIVETFISSLRKKVDLDEPHLIHTVRGVGYAIRPPR
ncbi:MAG: response regulator transcription factor [Microthrixaceae bacterium]|nr:response regulator transcription factor [Microthrixaceae bacterium]